MSNNPISYPHPNPNTHYHTTEDFSRLLSLTEESIFLQDGVFHSQDLIPKVFDSLYSFTDSSPNIEQMEELLTIGTADTHDLGKRIQRLSTTRVQEIARHHRYQLEILKAMWKYKREMALEKYDEEKYKEIIKSKESTKEPTLTPVLESSLSFKLTLCLLIPILQSYSESNIEVARNTVKLLFEEISNFPPNSLANESSNSLDQLEDLLCNWVNQNGESFAQDGCSALIALSCARGRLVSFIKTISVLEKCTNSTLMLPVHKVVKNLDKIGIQISKPCALIGENHILSWSLDTDLLATAFTEDKELGTLNHSLLTSLSPETENSISNSTNNQASSSGQSQALPNNVSVKISKKESEELPSRYFIATDGFHLYITGPKGKGISKVGTGFHGYSRGWVYTRNIHTNCGFIASTSARILSRPTELDYFEDKIDGKSVLCVELNSISLAPDRLVLMKKEDDLPKPHQTIGFTSDGDQLYLVRSELPSLPSTAENPNIPHSFFDRSTPKVLNIYLDTFKLVPSLESSPHLQVETVGTRLLLQRNDDEPHQHASHTEDYDRNERRQNIRRLRSLRASNIQETSAAQTMTAHAIAIAENYTTSLGLNYKQINQCIIFTCGNYLTFVTPNYWPPSFSVITTVGPTLPNLINPCNVNNNITKQYSPVMSQICSKSFGNQIHITLNGSQKIYQRQDLENLPITSSLFRGAVLQQMGGVYDSKNNIIWTTNGDYIDVWSNPGHLPTWRQSLLLPYPEIHEAKNDSNQIELRDTICYLMRHAGCMAINFLNGDMIGADIGFAPNIFSSLLELLFHYLRNFGSTELKAILLVLKASMQELKIVKEGSELHSSLKHVHAVLFCLMSDPIVVEKLQSSKNVYESVGDLFSIVFDFVYTTEESRNDFFAELYDFIDQEIEDGEDKHRKENRGCIKEALLKRFTDNLNNHAISFEDGIKWILVGPWMNRVIRDSINTVETFLSDCIDNSDKGTNKTNNSTILPRTDIETRYVGAVINFLLRNWTFNTDEIPNTLISLTMEMFKTILNHGCILTECGMNKLSKVDSLTLTNYTSYETIMQSSIMGLAIPQILAFLVSNEKDIKILEEYLLEECIQLAVAMSHFANKLNSRSSPQVGEDWASKIKVPAPWTQKKIVQSVHPIKDGTKIRETFVIPDARQLYIKFSPQCATQYDYDKLTILQGCGTTAKKVAECGGNYFGCGNKSFIGPGWPRDLIKIDGNVMTYIFEVKSTRESSTNDKAMYGYLFTIYPKYDYSDEDKPLRYPFDSFDKVSCQNGLISLISLHSIDAVQKIVVRMMAGENKSIFEKHAKPLLLNNIASRLQWKKSSFSEKISSNLNFTPEFVLQLRKYVGVAPLQIRSSIREKLGLIDFEDHYLQCCLKLAGGNPFINEEILNQDAEAWKEGPALHLLQTIFRNIDTTIRQLMAVSEMERMFVQEVEEVCIGLKNIGEMFFCDNNFRESESEMTILAMICDLNYDKDYPMNLTNDTLSMAQAFITEGASPKLSKSDDLVEEYFAKLDHLFYAKTLPDIELNYSSETQVLKLFNDIQSFVFSHFIHANATLKNLNQAVVSTTFRANNRLDALDIVHKLLECSFPNSALLTVAGIILMNGPDLKSIACSGYETKVLMKYGNTLKALVSFAEQNPLVHRYTVSLLCVIPYNRIDERNLVESKLLEILDQLCAYQMRVPLSNCPQLGIGHSVESNMILDLPPMSMEVHNVYLKTSALSWAAFRVLATRFATWEKTEATIPRCFEEDPESALPLQISINVTNHLARATNLVAGSSEDSQESLGKITCTPSLTDAIQDVLGLLSSLQEYKIGKAILKQSPCVCRLLSLLQDPRLSPRLVLTILKLLNTALPLVDNLDTEYFHQILQNKKPNTTGSESTTPSQTLNPYNQVASMLLSKLADFLVSGSQHFPKSDTTSRKVCNISSSSSPVTGLIDPTVNKISVWVQKRTDQLAASMLRQIFLDNSRLDLRPSRATLNQLENELDADGKLFLYTEDSIVAERKAMRLGQLGCIVSLEPAGIAGTAKDDGKSNKTGPQSTSVEMICKDKNANLASWDPPRPFISGQVAECLASEIVQLIRALLNSSKKTMSLSSSSSGASLSVSRIGSKTATEVGSSQKIQGLAEDIKEHLAQSSIWPNAVEQALCLYLKPLPKLLNTSNPTSVPLEPFVFSGRLAIASLTILGAFTETIRPGSEVWILEDDSTRSNISEKEEIDSWSFIPIKARVVEVSETGQTAHVEKLEEHLKKNWTLPLSKLLPCHSNSNTQMEESKVPNLSNFAITELAGYLKALLYPTVSSSKQDMFALKKQLPSLNQIVTAAGITSASTIASSKGHVTESRAIAHGMTVVRLLAEIRTRCMQLLSELLHNKEFLDVFLAIGTENELLERYPNSDVINSMNSLKVLAKGCKPSHRMKSVETQVAWMRLLYRDCTRPPRINLAFEKNECQSINWNISKTYPKVRSCVISTSTNSVVYVGDYNIVGGIPKGILLYATYGVTVPSFYWEATIVTMEETQNSDTGLNTPSVSIGFSPEAVAPEQRSNDPWRYPAGAVLYTIGGRIHHYKSQNPVNWITNRVDAENFKVKSGDTIGIGWEMIEGANGTVENSQRIDRPGSSGQRPVSRHGFRYNPPPIPPPLPTTPALVDSSRRVRIRNSNATIAPRSANQNQATINSISGSPGNIFFTLNGVRFSNVVEQNNCGLYPILHIQKRGIVVSTNLGTKPFIYAAAKKNIPENPPSQARGRYLGTSVSSSATEESGELLRRVSDSLQDLSLGLNFGLYNLENIESDSDLPISESDGALSADSDISDHLGTIESTDEGDGESDILLLREENNTDNSRVSLRNEENQGNAPNNPSFDPIDFMTPTIRVIPPSVSESNEDVQLNISGSAKANKSDSLHEISEKNKSDIIAKPVTRTEEYNPISSLDYFLEPCPANSIKVFSGPNRRYCSCAAHIPTPLDYLMLQKSNLNDKNETNSVNPTPPKRRQGPSNPDTENGMTEEEDDIHAQLARVWEQQVFPTIRRRFRNESERRDGLEQIRGALQLGMFEIARQTVEFLYEELGGIPRDLHLPSLEEVRLEASRCTVAKVKPGMSVLIRPFDSLEEYNSVLPIYAVPAMHRTFGLVGEVLEVDSAHELVLVESYVESEGILLRFWYPVSGLDKPQVQKKPSLNSNTVNMFKLHSNLLVLENSLCHMYSRSAFLELLDCIKREFGTDVEEILSDGTDASKQFPSSEEIPNQDQFKFSVEHLQILSDQSLAEFPLNRDLFTRNLSYGCPKLKYFTEMGNPATLFYKDTTKLSQELRATLSKAVSQGEPLLQFLNNQFLNIIENAQDKFTSYEAVTDKIIDIDIQVPEAAFTLISAKGLQPPKNSANSVDNVAHACFHISCYASGDIMRQPLICYPCPVLFTPSTDSGNTGRNTVQTIQTRPKALHVYRRNLKFPLVLVPTDRIHFNVSEAILKGLNIHIQGIPSQFPLALLYFQEILRMFSENDDISLNMIENVSSKWINFLKTTNIPPTMKEWVLSLITEAISIKRSDKAFSLDFILFRPNVANSFFTEMLFLSEKESDSVSNSQAFIVNSIMENFSSDTPNPSKELLKPSPNRATRNLSADTFMNKGSTSLQDSIATFYEANKTRSNYNPSFLSGYCQALFELCLALNSLHELSFNPMEVMGPLDFKFFESNRKLDSQQVTSTLNKNKKYIMTNVKKAKSTAPRIPEANRDKIVIRSLKHQRIPGGSLLSEKLGSSSRPVTPIISSSPPSPKVSDESTDFKSFEFEWFARLESSVMVFRRVVWNDECSSSSEAFQSLIMDAGEKISNPSTYERLVVVYGAPTNLPDISVETSLIKALKDCGGIFGNEIWVSGNCAVVELKCGAKLSEAINILKQNRAWYPLEDFLLYPSVNVYKVNQSLQTGDAFGDNALKSFLRSKITESQDQLSAKAEEVLSAIFMSCFSETEGLVEDESSVDDEFGMILLTNIQLSAKINGNLMQKFINAVKPDTCMNDFTLEILKKFGESRAKVYNLRKAGVSKSPLGSSTKASSNGCSNSEEEPQTTPSTSQSETKPPESNNGMTQSGFLNWCTQLIRDNIQGLWSGIFAAGYDLRFDRAWPANENYTEYSQYFSTQWTKEKDAALVNFIDSSAIAFKISPDKINPQEIYLSDSDLTNPTLKVLQGIPLEYLRVRTEILHSMNKGLLRDFLPYIGLQKFNYLKRSIAALLHDGRYLIYYHVKELHLLRLLFDSALRGVDVSTSEIFLDPVSALDSGEEQSQSLVSQAIPQLKTISSANYCIPPSTGSDPILPISVKYQGEEVLGLNGSFRNFILNVSKELQKRELKLFCKCPSADAGRNKDSLILCPGALSYKDEELLYFLGQIIGVAVRSDCTVPIPLLKIVWRSLLLLDKEMNDPTEDLIEADVLCANYLNKLQSLSSEKSFESFIALNGWPKFEYPSMDSDLTSSVPLCPGGKTLKLMFSNKEQFIRLVQNLRNKELKSDNRVNRILAGLSTIIPIPTVLNLFTANHLEYKICGSPQIDLALLKAHTHYQVGVSETDPHVIFFWSALESFSPEELKKFVKFACNMEQLPATCICQNNSNPQGFVAHVSPFPMKIAPTDTLNAGLSNDEIDKRLIRVETCLFLIRLPPYSSLQITKQQLLYAINCRDDPLSG